ncbi:MAG: hypothetical protein JO218_02915 [Burkholderiales bacterium]|nr:hypothetical protein [Burkholderiales bacterium]
MTQPNSKRPRRDISPEALDIPPSHHVDVILPAVPNPPSGPAEPVIVVGASTGGTEALKQFLMPMPADAPPILVAQHMPEMFTGPFAARLNTLCSITVKEAEHGEVVRPGVAYIAPGHSHLLLVVRGGRYVCELSQGQPVNRHKPSVDVLFRSAANCGSKHMVGVMLTGMGRDGALGMLEMRQAGAHNIAQDEATCVVFGMPKEAIALGAVDEVGPLQALAGLALDHIKTLPKAGRRV